MGFNILTACPRLGKDFYSGLLGESFTWNRLYEMEWNGFVRSSRVYVRCVRAVSWCGFFLCTLYLYILVFCRISSLLTWSLPHPRLVSPDMWDVRRVGGRKSPSCLLGMWLGTRELGLTWPGPGLLPAAGWGGDATTQQQSTLDTRRVNIDTGENYRCTFTFSLFFVIRL